MIEKMRKKFISIMMLSLTVVLILIMSLVNLVNYYQLKEQTNQKITYLAENDGRLPQKPKDDFKKPMNPIFETRYFVVHLNENYDILNINTSHISSISSSEALTYSQQVLSTRSSQGILHDYQYRIVENQNEILIVFVNVVNQQEAVRSFFVSSVWIVLASLLILFVIVVLASRQAINPLLRAIEKQKQFITDASHEIKTPLAIISANNEVLELEYGKNEWITSNQNQIHRLNSLLKKMMTLSKMEEDVKPEKSLINFSECVENTLQGFSSLLRQKEIHLETTIEENIMIEADVEMIQELVNILMDNAVKYVQDPNYILVKLYRNHLNCIFEVFNTCPQLHIELDQLFERFYRYDKARSSLVKGQGIGLSIAKLVVQAHGGKIKANYQNNGLLMKVEL